MQKVKGRIDVTRKINPFYVYQKIDCIFDKKEEKKQCKKKKKRNNASLIAQ